MLDAAARTEPLQDAGHTPSGASPAVRLSAAGSGNGLLNVLERLLAPAAQVGTLFLLPALLEGGLPPRYLILAVIVFALSFPGNARLQMPWGAAALDVALNWLWVVALLLATGFITGFVHDFNRDVLLAWFWLAPATELGACLWLKASAPALVRLQGPRTRALIVGINEQGLELADRIVHAPYCRIELAGFVDGRAAQRPHHAATQDATQDNAPDNIVPLLGPLHDLAEVVKRERVQHIFLSMPMAAQPRILQVLDVLKDTTASIFFVPDMFVTDLIQGRPGWVCNLPVISVCDTPFTGINGLLKRGSDIVFASVILLLILPVLLAVGLAIKLTSPGPALFVQRRYGLDGKEIHVYKFRSMTVSEDGATVVQAQRNDQRVTPLGAFLRRTSLDELPQFINVLQGRMSVVGPRPHAVAHNELYRKLVKGYMVRHKVKPGITGAAQVNGFRGETDTLDKMKGRVEHDLDYLRNWSLKLDVLIILKTIRVVLRDQQAY